MPPDGHHASPPAADVGFTPREQALIAAGRLFLQAEAHAAANRLAQADALFTAVLDAVPGHALSLAALGNVRARLGRLPEAEALLRDAAERGPALPAARHDLGIVLLEQHRPDEAAAQFERALALDGRHLSALVGLGTAHAAANRPHRAAGSFGRALALDPDHVPALANLARLLMEQGETTEALRCARRVAVLRPNSAEAHFNLGTALRASGHPEAAGAALHEALRLDPAHHRALLNLGNIHKEADRFADAAACFEQALALEPAYVPALNNLGHVRQEQGEQEAALALHRRAAALAPADSHSRVALCVAELPVVPANEADHGRARAAYAARLHELRALDERGTLDLADAVGSTQPFFLPYANRDDRALQSTYGALVCRSIARRFPPLPPPAPPAPGERVRVGIVSGFFRRHSNWKIPVRGWLRTLPRDRFQLIGYHTGARQDEATDEARALCDRFVQGPFRTERWREEIAADAPHVLIWPEIGMDPAAARLAAQRLAPTQCTSWGQPVTSGFPTVDHFLSSELMEPPGAERHYTERLVLLPNLGVVCQPTPPGPLAPDRAAFGLRPDAVVFWCGQSLPKFLPEHDWIFPAVAAAAPAAQFLFIEHQHGARVNAVFRARLRAAFDRAGLDADRHCRLVPHMGKDRFMQSLAAADALLDTPGWAGCNTTLEALAHDLPVLTHAGPFMRGRHGAAILRRMDMPGTVAATPDGLVSLAARLAHDTAWRAALRRDTAARKHRLFDDQAAADALADFLDHAARAPTQAATQASTCAAC